MAKITRATFKSFIKKNPEFLINVKSKFDGMTDGVERMNGGFGKAMKADRAYDNNLGIQGVWLVLGGGDRFSEYSKDGLRGIEVYNCCGSFVVAVKE